LLPRQLLPPGGRRLRQNLVAQGADIHLAQAFLFDANVHLIFLA
jgi:hypothetical protein